MEQCMEFHNLGSCRSAPRHDLVQAHTTYISLTIKYERKNYLKSQCEIGPLHSSPIQKYVGLIINRFANILNVGIQ